jgi:NDP-sugar pyrophosphorylase family protein
MLGRAISETGRKYNIIILAGGAGSRMGTASDYIPKALTKLGNQRAIDYIIERYSSVAHKFIIGIGYHADLLKSYLLGQYKNLDIEFSYEEPSKMANNAISTIYCLDHADSRYSTIVTFCDLLIASNFYVHDNTVLVAKPGITKGRVGTFRHVIPDTSSSAIFHILEKDPPVSFNELLEIENGVLGTFIFGDTKVLKSCAYNSRIVYKDFTKNIVFQYTLQDYIHLTYEPCKLVYEFGNELDLAEVRRGWENA